MLEKVANLKKNKNKNKKKNTQQERYMLTE